MFSRFRNRYQASRILVTDLYPLSTTEIEDGPDYLRTVYGWYVDREMTIVRIFFAGAGAFTVALITAILKQGHGPSILEIIAPAGSALILSAIAVGRLTRLATVHREFVCAQLLLAHFRYLYRLMHSP